MSSPPPSGLEFTALNPAYSADPDTPLARLREETPVLKDDAFGMYVVSRYGDVRALLADRTMLKDPEKAEAGALALKFLLMEPDGLKYSGTKNILIQDDPEHSRVRGAITKVFYKRVAGSRGIVEGVVARILDGLVGRKRFDAMSEFAVQVPIDVIAGILGADPSRLDEFRQWSVDSFEFFNMARTEEQTKRMVDASNALYGYIDELIRARRCAPGDDLVSDLLAAGEAGKILSDAEIRENCAGLLAAGNLTTTDLIGNGLWLLLMHPEDRAKLATDRDLINNAIEEILRFEPPVEITTRIAPKDMAVRGCPIHQTQGITTQLRAANRDPEIFADPNRFDVTRKHVPHVSFGGGSHICIGAPLARLEAQVAIPAFLDRFPGLKLENTTPRWRTLPSFRGLQSLSVLVD